MPKKLKNIDLPETSSTGDIVTNDFDFSGHKAPVLSTVRTQLREALALHEKGYTLPLRTEFDRLRIALNLNLYGAKVEFENWGMEDVPDPQKPPSYDEDTNLKLEKFRNSSTLTSGITEDDFDIEEEEFFAGEDDLFEDEEVNFSDTINRTEKEKQSLPEENYYSLYDYTSVKKRIPYYIYKNAIGLNNMFINKGFFVIDITGKWMHGLGVLGSLHKDNIREALQEILNLHVVTFDIGKFIKYAQVFGCDVFVDLLLASEQQVEWYVDGLSSFFPISTNRQKISKYSRHGLSLIPKAKTRKYSFTVYSKGKDLSYRLKRNTWASKYTYNIGFKGQELAERTLRLEAKLHKFHELRDLLDIPEKRYVVSLTDVLNSKAPVMLKMFELFSGKPEVLLERLSWLSDTITTPEDNSLKDICIAEWFVNLLRENNFDILTVRSHIRVEYANVKDSEIEKFNQLANIRKNILNYIVYKKPKSTTIMLDILRRLYDYYSTGMGVSHE